MTVKAWPAQVRWSDLPAGQRRKVTARLGRLIRRCLADPRHARSREAGDDAVDHHDRREDPPAPP
jgi:hypothetical protein